MQKGLILEERYKIIEEVGKGGAGKVYKALHLNLNIYCAVKQIPNETNKDVNNKNEALLLTRLKHDSLPKVYDVFVKDGFTYIVRDFVEGLNLREYLGKKVSLYPSEIKSFVHQLASVFTYFHSQNPPLIYRDLKPENVMVDKDSKLKLIDFGTVRKFSEEKTDDTMYVGSRKYAAPEQYGLYQSTIRTDLYSFALLFYFIYTGDDYLEISKNKEKIWNKFKISSAYKYKEIIEKAISINDRDRYQNISEFVDALYPSVTKSNDLTIPMLEYKTLKTNIGQKTNIALMGLGRMVGTSHISFCIAKILSDYGISIYSENSDISSLHLLECFVEMQDEDTLEPSYEFVHKKISFYSNMTKLSLEQIMSEDYSFGVFDYGSDFFKLNDFLKMSKKFFVLPSSPMSYVGKKEIIKEVLKYKDLMFIINLAKKESIKLAHWLNIPRKRIIEFPFTDDPLTEFDDSELILNMLNLNNIEKNNDFKSKIRRMFKWEDEKEGNY